MSVRIYTKLSVCCYLWVDMHVLCVCHASVPHLIRPPKKAKGGTAKSGGTERPDVSAAGVESDDAVDGYKDVLETLPEEARNIPGQTRGKHNYTLQRVPFAGRIQVQLACKAFYVTHVCVANLGEQKTDRKGGLFLQWHVWGGPHAAWEKAKHVAGWV